MESIGASGREATTQGTGEVYAGRQNETKGDFTIGIFGALGLWGFSVSYPLLPKSLQTGLGPLLPLLAVALLMMLATLLAHFATGRLQPQRHPLLVQRRYGAFLARVSLEYLLTLLIYAIFWFLYQHLSEYGYQRKADYYQPFFQTYEWILLGVALLAWPYFLITQAVLYQPDADRKEPFTLLLKGLGGRLPQRAREGYLRLLARVGLEGIEPSRMDRQDGNILLGLLVKGFFVPLMLVFYFDQFGHFQNNLKFLQESKLTNLPFRDWYNLLLTAILMVDVGIALIGYVFTLRWLGNKIISVEPTLLGWISALLCYPPFRMVVGFYLILPQERDFLNMDNQPWVWFFGGLSLLSYFLYMLATLAFGMKFSNLTHRGIIKTGPYRYLRHPAYAAKNLAWWLVMFPLVLIQAMEGLEWSQLVQILGLVGMTYLYYLRALTEEKHLSADPDYRKYCDQTPWRFVPGLL